MNHVVLVLDASLMEFMLQKDLRIEEFCLLVLLARGEKGLLETYCRKGYTVDQKRVILQSLIRKQLVYLKDESEVFKIEDYILTEEGKEVMEQAGSKAEVLEIVTGDIKPQTDMDQLVSQYLELFPKGVRNGGNKTLKSNATDVKAKLMKFMGKYKHTPDVILKATSQYLEKLRGSYTYCPTAEYFILKDGSSALASECDRVTSGADDDELINPFQKTM